MQRGLEIIFMSSLYPANYRTRTMNRVGEVTGDGRGLAMTDLRHCDPDRSLLVKG
jgi:hypothetical protein